jgi:hypothetical protein
MTDSTKEKTAPEETTEAPAKETPEETPAAENAAMAWPMQPVPMPGVFDVVAQEVDGQSIIVLATYTSAGASFAWTTRQNALALASRIKKIANTGPKLIIPGQKGE